MATHKLDIFRILNNINKKIDFYDTLTTEEQKSIQPLVLMKWLSGTSSMRQIAFLNEIVNPYIFTLSNHKKLLIWMLTICGLEHTEKANWIKNKKTSNISKSTKIVAEYFGYSMKKAYQIMHLLSDDDIISYATQLGTDKKDITILKRELKNRS